MARKPRLFFKHSHQHIMMRGNNKMRIFHKPGDYTYYLGLIRSLQREHLHKLYHYCLMPNHIHLLVKINTGDDFSRFMKRLNLAYQHYYSRQYSWIGTLWQGRFKSQLVGNDTYFVHCGKYIELNPVRANIVSRAELYPYSSYRYYLFSNKSLLVTLDPHYLKLSDEPERRAEIYRQLIIEEQIRKTYSENIWASRHQTQTIQQRIRRTNSKM